MSDNVRSEATTAEQAAAPRLDEYPDRLLAKHMAAIFRVSQKRLHALDAAGACYGPRIGRVLGASRGAASAYASTLPANRKRA